MLALFHESRTVAGNEREYRKVLGRRRQRAQARKMTTHAFRFSRTVRGPGGREPGEWASRQAGQEDEDGDGGREALEARNRGVPNQ